MNSISLLLRKRMNKTLIIGGGAAGLYASTLLPDAVILEGNGGCGIKLLLTGGGRCNYTHSGTVQDFLPHYHGSLPFVLPKRMERSSPKEEMPLQFLRH